MLNQHFHEKFDAPVKELSQLHLCRYVEVTVLSCKLVVSFVVTTGGGRLGMAD